MLQVQYSIKLMGGNFDIFDELQIMCGYEYPNQYEFVVRYPEGVINIALVADL